MYNIIYTYIYIYIYIYIHIEMKMMFVQYFEKVLYKNYIIVFDIIASESKESHYYIYIYIY